MMAGLVPALHNMARPYLDAVDQMRRDGIEQDIPIPQIAVMGDQSSGKSSVLEALSGIPFPRGSGLVTRCVTQITMSEGPAWCAVVQAGGEKQVIDESQKDSIGELIRVLTDKLCGKDTFGSADKIIEIQVTAPDAPNLTLIDLPGIVRNASDDICQNVDSMLEKFLQQPRTVVLAVIPCTVDIETVDILNRAKRVDPNGERTVGVFTMPDLINPGGEDQVLNVLHNKTHMLHHGYYMLKNRSQKELEEGADVRSVEVKFLETSNFFKNEARFGVNALVAALAKILVSLIHTSLPQMLVEIDTKTTEKRKALLEMGEDPPLHAGTCRLFALQNIRGLMTRVESEEKIYMHENKAYKKFVHEMHGSKPGFDGEDDRFTVKAHADCYHGNTRYNKGDTLSGQKWDMPKSVTRIGEAWPDNEKAWRVYKMEHYYRSEIMEEMEANRGKDMAGFMSFKVCTTIVCGYVASWEPCAEQFRMAVREGVHAEITDAARCEAMPASLMGKVVSELRAHVEECDADARDELSRLHRNEREPMTQNHYLSDTIRKRHARSLALALPDGSSDKDTTITLLTAVTSNESNEARAADDMIDWLAAYWKLATKRYIDNVGQAVRQCYTSSASIQRLDTRITSMLLKLDDGAMLALFYEPPDKTMLRHNLRERVDALERARRRIDSLMATPSQV